MRNKPLPLDPPRRAPIDPDWRRYLSALQARTGTIDVDFVKEDRFLSGEVTIPAPETKRLQRQRREDEFRVPVQMRDRRISKQQAVIREFRFLEGF